MQVSSFLGLQTALRGLTAQQRAMDITSHNISNAQTEGYTRQEVAYAAAGGLRLPAGIANGGGAWLGQGVEIEQFRRMRDTFLDLQYRTQRTGAAYDEDNDKGVRRALDQFNEPGEEGVNTLLERFWQSWNQLASQPNDTAVKTAIVGNATTLTSALNGLETRLAGVSADAAAQFTALTTGAQNPITPMANELAQLNTEIKRSLGAGTSPNELLDRRDLLLDKLAELARVSVTDLGNGAISVDFGDAATPLVNDAVVTWPQALTTPGGKLEALLDVQTSITAYRADLDAFVSTLVTAVNTAHTAGGGPNFFSGATAGTIAVNVTPATVNAGSTPAAGANDIARAIAALAEGTADRLYATLVSRIGHESSVADTATTSSTALLSTIENRRLSVSGISIDEEVTNMIRYQRAYQASSRTMSAMDEMLDTLINRTGRVGL